MARKMRALQLSLPKKNFVLEIKAYLQTISDTSVSFPILAPMLHPAPGGDSKVLLPKVFSSAATVSLQILESISVTPHGSNLASS
jgi:hypothetical protein